MLARGAKLMKLSLLLGKKDKEADHGGFDNFDDWMNHQSAQNEGSGIPMKLQFELAAILCDKANYTPPKFIPSSDRANDHGGDDEPGRHGRPLVRWEGIHVDWFRDVFLQLPEIQQFLRFKCRMWFVRTAGLVEILKRRNIHDGTLMEYLQFFEKEILSSKFKQMKPAPPITGKATVFVSFTGFFTLELFAHLLIDKLPAEYVWIDTFCVNQFAWTQRKDDEMIRFKKGFMNDLKERIGQIGRTALMQERWDNFMEPLTRIWVVWEMFSTVDTRAKLQVLLSDTERGRFQLQTFGTPEVVDKTYQTLATIDVRKATAAKEKDRQMIFSLIEGKQGAQYINHGVTRLLREWLLEAAEEAYTKSQGETQMIFGCNLAFLHVEIGNHNKGHLLYERTLRDSIEILGPLHPTTLTCKHNMLSRFTTNYEKDLRELREVYEARCHVLGELHQNTLSTLRSLVTRTNDPTEQLGLLQYLKEKGSEIFGERNGYVLSWSESFAKSLAANGRLEEAEALLRKDVETRRKTFGDRHADTLKSITTLATVLQGERLVEAEQLFREAYDGLHEMLDKRDSNTYGVLLLYLGKAKLAERTFNATLSKLEMVSADATNINTCIIRGNLALSLRDQGRLDEAAAIQQEAYGDLLENHEEASQFTWIGLQNLATIKHEQGCYDEAEKLFRRALLGLRNTGKPWPHMCRTMKNLGNLLCDRSSLSESQELLEEAMSEQQQVCPKHHETLSTIFALSLVYVLSDQWSRARLLLSHGVDSAVSICYGPTHDRSKMAQTVIQQLAHTKSAEHTPRVLIDGLKKLRK